MTKRNARIEARKIDSVNLGLMKHTYEEATNAAPEKSQYSVNVRVGKDALIRLEAMRLFYAESVFRSEDGKMRRTSIGSNQEIFENAFAFAIGKLEDAAAEDGFLEKAEKFVEAAEKNRSKKSAPDADAKPESGKKAEKKIKVRPSAKAIANAKSRMPGAMAHEEVRAVQVVVPIEETGAALADEFDRAVSVPERSDDPVTPMDALLAICADRLIEIDPDGEFLATQEEAFKTMSLAEAIKLIFDTPVQAETYFETKTGAGVEKWIGENSK